MTLSYLGVHAAFTLPVLAVLLATAPRYDDRRRRRSGAGLALLVAIAFAYTTPWGSAMIRTGVWWYGEGAVVATALDVPLGEFLFFGVQTLIVGLALHRIGFDPTFRDGDAARLPRVGGAVAGLACCVLGLWLVARGGRVLYLGGLLAWVGPVFALQWAVGGGYLARTARTWLPAALAPAAYLWVVDRIAIGLGTWTVSSTHTVGVAPAGLPVEEMLFFLAAGLMTVNGLVLFEWVLDWTDRRRTPSADAATDHAPTASATASRSDGSATSD